jgi:glucose/arabinose dehydrogenase
VVRPARTALAVAACLGAAVTPAEARVRLERVATLSGPIHATTAPGDRRSLYVAERRGRVRVLRRGRLLRRPLLDISHLVEIRDRRFEADHGGLFSVAFAPDYARSRRVYVFYSHVDGSLRVEEIRRGARRLVLRLPDRPSFDLGGQIAFGPDGFLYVGLGDQSDSGASRDLGDLRGKLIRIDPRPSGGRPYRVPRGNPFAGAPGTAAEIWAYGLRNPFRFTFSPGGALVVGDVGESRVEEIHLIPPRRAGADLGWNLFDGRRRVRPGDAPAHLPPVIEHSHARRFCSVIGGIVVRDRSLPLFGRYLYSDFCNGRLRSARLTRAGARGVRGERPVVIRPVAFGEDARRRVYVVTLLGPVYRLVSR